MNSPKYLLQIWCDDYMMDGYHHSYHQDKASAISELIPEIKKYSKKKSFKFKLLQTVDVTPELMKELYAIPSK